MPLNLTFCDMYFCLRPAQKRMHPRRRAGRRMLPPHHAVAQASSSGGSAGFSTEARLRTASAMQSSTIRTRGT